MGNKLNQAQVEWYSTNGKYPERIATDKTGRQYIVGDWHWNILHPNKFERIEQTMRFAGITIDNYFVSVNGRLIPR